MPHSRQPMPGGRLKGSRCPWRDVFTLLSGCCTGVCPTEPLGKSRTWALLTPWTGREVGQISYRDAVVTAAYPRRDEVPTRTWFPSTGWSGRRRLRRALSSRCRSHGISLRVSVPAGRRTGMTTPSRGPTCWWDGGRLGGRWG